MTVTERIQRDDLIRQAERFGTEEVFETALEVGLPLRDLGVLALRLQNLDSRWKLTVECQEMFVRALAEIGVSTRDAARMAGVSTPTAAHWLLDSQDDDDPGPEAALRRASKDRHVELKGIVRGWSKRRR